MGHSQSDANTGSFCITSLLLAQSTKSVSLIKPVEGAAHLGRFTPTQPN
jgi:hypothetical protein